jgi:uncharacterized membrane protein
MGSGRATGARSFTRDHNHNEYYRSLKEEQAMASVEKSIEVDVPVNTAYNQWTQFEEFPRFMEGVKEVRQLDDARIHWRAEVAGKEEEWDAEITSQVPDQRVAWRSVSGLVNAGIVTFHPAGNGRTRVDLRLEYEPDGLLETIGDALGAVSSRVEGDLERFKDFIEARGQETGAWRGHIQSGEVKEGNTSRPGSTSAYPGDLPGSVDTGSPSL